jgi:ribosomal protein L7Ae-like RNA K-turn-binding protein
VPTRAAPQDERLLGLLGLGARSGVVVIGAEQIRAALRRGQAACLMVARDVSPRVREKVVRLAVAKGVPLVSGPPAEAIGARLGRPPVMAVGIVERALARGMLDLAQEPVDGGGSGQDSST